MTPDELGAIKARADAATPGPWETLVAGTGIRGGVPYAWLGPVKGDRVMPVLERQNAGTVADAEFAAHARTDVPALVAEVERLWEALGQTEHVISFTEDGWAIEHLVACRPDMTSCGLHQAAMVAREDWDGPPRPPGRYVVTLDVEGSLLIGEPV